MRRTLLLLAVMTVWGGALAATSSAVWQAFDKDVADAKTAMMADPKAALDIAHKASVIARGQPRTADAREALATSLWLEGEAYTRINQVPQARAAIDEAIKLASGNGRLTKLDGDLELSQARLASAEGKIALSLKSYQKAHEIFAKLGQLRGQSMALQGLGVIYDEAHDFDREIDYYRQALQVSTEPALVLSIDNNIGFARQQAGRYDEAVKDFQRAFDIAVAMKSPLLEARILTNLAAVYAKQDKFADAQGAANKALRLLGKNDESGWAPFVWGVKAEIEYRRGRLDAAVTDLENAFRGMDLTTTIAPFRDIHEIAYKVYRAKGNAAMALQHLEAFKRLDDQGRSLAASANLALMGAQFDFATQRFEIEHLRSEQLRRDISLKESRAATQRVIFIALIAAGLLFMLWVGWRHHVVHKHRKELTRTLKARDREIARRIETEGQLRLATAAAEEANLAKSHFLANMSHELRTPLNAIIGFSDIMANVPLQQDKNQEYARDINTSGQKLLAVLTDILDMARLDARTMTLSEDNVNLAQAVKDVVAAAEAPAGKHIHIEADLGVVVRGDERRLRQIADNLVSNAIKFTRPEGRIDVTVRKADDGGAELIVADDGMGISPEQLALTLEPFGQVEGTYARSHGGAGLGLPIVKSLAELHGGSLAIRSEVGEGTTVRVHLPAERMLSQRPRSLAS